MSRINGFKGDFNGLTSEQAKTCLLKFGPNELVREDRFRLLFCLLSIFKEPMFLLLFGAAGCYFLLGEPGDGFIMLGFVVFVAGINFFQEYRTDRTLQALKKLTAPHVEVVRDGVLQKIDSRELVPGDIMLLNEGERISADGRILEFFDLGVDESILTGESETVWKTGKPDGKANWKPDCVYAGTTVVYGTALVEVSATAFQTEYGKISQSLQAVKSPRTPLEKEVGHLIKCCTVIAVSACLLCSIIDFLARGKIVNSLLAGVTLAMSVIPEELPVILTVFMAIGAWRLAKANALMRKIPAVETLGSVTVLCSDKTGTLTENRMSLESIVPAENLSEEILLQTGVLASESVPSDPMEQAIQLQAKRAGVDVEKTLSHTLKHEYPFRSETKMMGHVWEIDGEIHRCIKGSPESILPLCELSPNALAEQMKQQETMMERGFRVIAVASSRGGNEVAQEITGHRYQLVGLLGFIDPPRKETPSSILTAEKAGIRVVIITGDHAVTARAIAERIGNKFDGKTMTGAELDALSDDELSRKVEHVSIFARVMPHHKLRIVRALQANHEVVAMTGDGVNDAPALKAADIGVAMGKRGTEVAREAADMILLDDNFSTIVHSVADGRRIYDNIRKAIGYVFVIHIPIALLALLNPLLFDGILLLLPIHVVLLELVIDPTSSIIFERMPPEDNIMSRPPRKNGESLLDWKRLGKALLQGLVIFGGVAASTYFLHVRGASIEVLRAFMLLYLVMANFFLVYVNASETKSIFSTLHQWKDKTVWLINILVIMMPFFLIYTKYGNLIARTVPLPLADAGCALLLAVLAAGWYEAVKFFRRLGSVESV